MKFILQPWQLMLIILASWANLQAFVERVIQTLKHEVLNGFCVVSETHLDHILRVAQDWYNHRRGHTEREHLIETGQIADQAEVARTAGITRARVTQILNLNRLAPDIKKKQHAILNLEPTAAPNPNLEGRAGPPDRHRTELDQTTSTVPEADRRQIR